MLRLKSEQQPHLAYVMLYDSSNENNYYYKNIRFVKISWLAFVYLSLPPPSRLLASKNLPAAIEDTSGNEVPESIREKAEALQSQGGATGLEQKIYGLPELLQRNKEIIDEVGGPRSRDGGVVCGNMHYARLNMA